MRPTLSRRLVLPTLSLAGFIGIMTACSDDKATEGAAPPPDSPNKATLADNSHGVRTEPTAMDDGTITFADNEETAAFGMGDVLAPRERIKKPYLRKILGIDRKGGRIVFKTRNASLTELFKEAHIHQKIEFGDPKWTVMNPEVMPAQPKAQPFTLGSGEIRPKKLEAFPGGSATFTFGGKTIELGSGGAYFDPRESYVQVGGGIEFDYDYNAWYDPTPTLVHLAASGWFQAKLGAKAGASGSVTGNLFEEVWPYKPHLGTIYFQAGIVPIFIDVNLAFATKIDATLGGKVDVHAATTVHFAMKAGVHYEHGRWSPIKELSTSMQDELQVSGDATLAIGAHPIDTKLQFQLYGLIGPFVELDPYLSIEGNLLDGSLARTIGLKGSAGGNIEVLGYKLGEFKLDLFDWKHELDTMQACISANYTGDGGTAGSDRCKLETLRNCVNNRGGVGCVSLPQPGGGGTACGAPDNHDSLCDIGKLLQCQCEKLYANKPGAAKPAAPAGADGDCFARYCTPCTKEQTVCSQQL